MATTEQRAVTRDDALAFADEAFRNRDITFSHRDVVDMTGALSTFLQRHRLGATAIASAEQSAATPWFAWPARKTWEEVRVRLRSRDGNEWEEIASDFEYWMQSADGEMCDDVVAFQIIGETPLGLASVSSASAETLALQAIKVVTATAKDGAADLSRIMAIANAAGVQASYSDLLQDPAVALIVERPRAEWAHLFKPDAKGCAIPPEGWQCSRARGHAGPCAASPEPVPATNQAGEVERLRAVLVRICEEDRHTRRVKPNPDGGFRGHAGMIAAFALTGKNGSHLTDEDVRQHVAALGTKLETPQDGEVDHTKADYCPHDPVVFHRQSSGQIAEALAAQPATSQEGEARKHPNGCMLTGESAVAGQCDFAACNYPFCERATDREPMKHLGAGYTISGVLAEMLAVGTADDEGQLAEDWPLDCRADVDRWQAVIRPALAATPTLPTLSEDLRAFAEQCAQRDDSIGDDARAALAQVKAS